MILKVDKSEYNHRTGAIAAASTLLMVAKTPKQPANATFATQSISLDIFNLPLSLN